MKSLYESLLTGNVRKPSAKIQPRSKEELIRLIDEYTTNIKPGQEVNLNWIDILRVDDLSYLFQNTNYIPVINTWKIDHVKDFAYMFFNNKYITRSPLPRLQEKLLDIRCYEGMFSDCSALERAPELPAKKLTLGCYKSMFSYCVNLKIPPKLPAKKMKIYCYKYMFDGCTKLQTPPDLPATELDEGCYSFMFHNCVSLTRTAKRPKPNKMITMYGMYMGCKLINYITKEDL